MKTTHAIQATTLATIALLLVTPRSAKAQTTYVVPGWGPCNKWVLEPSHFGVTVNMANGTITSIDDTDNHGWYRTKITYTQLHDTMARCTTDPCVPASLTPYSYTQGHSQTQTRSWSAKINLSIVWNILTGNLFEHSSSGSFTETFTDSAPVVGTLNPGERITVLGRDEHVDAREIHKQGVHPRENRFMSPYRGASLAVFKRGLLDLFDHCTGNWTPKLCPPLPPKKCGVDPVEPGL